MTLLFKIIETVVKNKGGITMLIEKPGDVGTLVLKGQRRVGSTRTDQNGSISGGVRHSLKILDETCLLVPVQFIDHHLLYVRIKKDFFLAFHLYTQHGKDTI